jgi:hypothetical protein
MRCHIGNDAVNSVRLRPPWPVELPDGEWTRHATAADFPPLPELATRASDLERKAMMSALLKRGENMVLRRHHVEDGAQRARRRASRRTRSGLPVVPVLCVATGKVADRHLPDTRLKKELS